MGLQVLDCTLRDGGYVNNWEFGRHAICSILEKLDAGGIDMVECGFLTNQAEAALLQTPAHQLRLAAAMTAGLLNTGEDTGGGA